MKKESTGKRGHMVLKFDMSKSYARVDLSAEEEICRAMGNLRLYTLSYSIMLNRCPSSKFLPRCVERPGIDASL